MISEQFTLGIDDTDVPGGPGTGALVRALAAHAEAEGWGQSAGVTRHALLRSAKIAATDGNYAYALVLSSQRSVLDLEDAVVDFVRAHAARGADAAVALLSRHSDLPHVLAFGRRCQQEVMNLADAERFAAEGNVRLRGLGPRRAGTVGALGAAGLRAGGGDGRFIALRGIRELEGRLTAGEIRERTEVAKVIDEQSGEDLDRDDVVDTLGWIRPRLVEGGPVLLTRRSREERRLWLPVDRRPPD